MNNAEKLDHIALELDWLQDAPYQSLPREKEPLFDELYKIAALRGFPVDIDRDDAQGFLDDARKVSSASKEQCGGVIRKLQQGDWKKHLQCTGCVARRMAQLLRGNE
jgi:hypothetical protein